jgi:hypothetical protein
MLPKHACNLGALIRHRPVQAGQGKSSRLSPKVADKVGSLEKCHDVNVVMRVRILLRPTRRET